MIVSGSAPDTWWMPSRVWGAEDGSIPSGIKIMDNTSVGHADEGGQGHYIVPNQAAMAIMGARRIADLDSSSFYPLMQVTGIFRLDIDLAYAGMDREGRYAAREAESQLEGPGGITYASPS